MTPSIDIYQAFYWICPGCDSQNFKEFKAIIPSEQELDDIMRTTDVEQDEEFVTLPDTVKCEKCKAIFKMGEDN